MIDGNNVMGSRPDGWWRDRAGAKARLAAEIAGWAAGSATPVLLFFDGRPDQAIVDAGPGLVVRFADRAGRDAADDLIAAEATPGDTVVTADRGLIGRLSDGVDTLGPSRFLATIGP